MPSSHHQSCHSSPDFDEKQGQILYTKQQGQTTHWSYHFWVQWSWPGACHLCEGQSLFGCWVFSYLTIYFRCFVISEKGVVQVGAGTPQRESLPASPWHEGAMRINLCVEESSIVMQGMWLLLNIDNFMYSNKYYIRLWIILFMSLHERSQMLKINNLILSENEWTRVWYFCNLLEVCHTTCRRFHHC